jgi:ABC-2 type transport system ATP-binding protein
MTATIEVENLSKYFNGRQAVKNINLSIDAGKIFGLVGPNGSGKTCTLRMMATLMEPDSGDVRIGGYSIIHDKSMVRRLIGYLPDRTGVYSRMKVYEYLDFFASCYQIPKNSRHDLIDDLLDLVDLSHRKDDWMTDLSLGLQRRLELARLLVHDPQFLLLDEPLAGLDPKGKKEFQNLLVELARMGKTIFMTSHSMPETSEICNRVAIIEGGELAAVGEIPVLLEQFAVKRQIQITILDEIDAVKKLLEKVPVVSNVHSLPAHEANQQRVEMEFRGDEVLLSQVLTYLTKSGIQVIHFTADDNDLERIMGSATPGQVS